MDKDNETIGYAVKIGNGYVKVNGLFFGVPDSVELVKDDGIFSDNFGFFDKETAVKIASGYNGKVVELYAREISEDDLSKDD